eukprot:3320552-Rhodomonas_salina.3
MALPALSLFFLWTRLLRILVLPAYAICLRYMPTTYACAICRRYVLTIHNCAVVLSYLSTLCRPYWPMLPVYATCLHAAYAMPGTDIAYALPVRR